MESGGYMGHEHRVAWTCARCGGEMGERVRLQLASNQVVHVCPACHASWRALMEVWLAETPLLPARRGR